MSIKPFAIQGSDLTLGGVNLQAGATTIVIPGVTQATNYRVEEVNETDVEQTFSNFPAESEVVVIDKALYDTIVAEGNESTFADFTATTDDEGYIDEIQVNGQGTYSLANADRARLNNMYAYIGAGSASDRPLVPEDWIQIPFRPKMRAGEITNAPGAGGSGGVVERSINFPEGDDGDTRGTQVLTPGGSIYVCTSDYVNVGDYGGTYEVETSQDQDIGQSGGTYNAINILAADYPEIAYIFNNTSDGAQPGNWLVNAGSAYGGTQTCTLLGNAFNATLTFYWPHRTGVDPEIMNEGFSADVIWDGPNIQQPRIWKQTDLGNLQLVDGYITRTRYQGGESSLELERDDVQLQVDNDDDNSIAKIRLNNTDTDATYVAVIVSPATENTPPDYGNIWKFKHDGSLEFPDGTLQTTAYTGQSSSTGELYIMANVDGDIVTSTNGIDWGDPQPSGMNGISKVEIHNGVIVYIDNGSEGPPLPGLYYSTEIGTVTLCAGTDVGGITDNDLFWNEVHYFSATDKWVAVGYNQGDNNRFPIVAHSDNGIAWTVVFADNTFVEGFNPDGDDWQLRDVAYLDETNQYIITSALDGALFGGIFLTDDITTALDGTNHVAIDGDFDEVAPWSVVAFTGPPGYVALMPDNDPDPIWFGFGSVVSNYAPDFEGVLADFIIGELGYLPDISEVAYRNGNFIAVTSDGQVITPSTVGGPGGPGFIVSIPLPYTNTTFSISNANPAVITWNGNNAEANNEKIVVTLAGEYNGTYYVNSVTRELYTDQAMTTALDASGFAAFTSGTLTFSHGMYFDAAGASNSYFYIGNDDEQIFRSSNGITWTQQADVTGDYFNDFAYGSFGVGSESTLTNGVHVFALENDGTLTLDGEPFNGNGFATLSDGTLQANTNSNTSTLTSTLQAGRPTWLTITPRSPDRNTLDTHYGFDNDGMWFSGDNEETSNAAPAYPIHTTDSFPADVKTVVEFDFNYVDGNEDWGLCVYPADGVPHWDWDPHPSRIAAMIDIGDGSIQINGLTDSTFRNFEPATGIHRARFTYDPIAELTTFEAIVDGQVVARCQQPGRLARNQDYRIGFDADWDDAVLPEKSYFSNLTITSGNTTDAKATELTVTGEIKLPNTTKGFVNIQGPWDNGDDNLHFQTVVAHDGFAYMGGETSWNETDTVRLDKYSLATGELVWTRVLGAGRNAEFNISWTGNVYTIDSIMNSGDGYKTGDLLYIAGFQLGGDGFLNRATITVTGVDGSGSIQTATIAGTAPAGDGSMSNVMEYSNDGHSDPISIKYDTVNDNLVMVNQQYTVTGDAEDLQQTRAVIVRVNPVSGDVISTVTLSDEGDIYPYDVAVHPTTGATAVVGEKFNEYRQFGTLTMAVKGNGYFDILKSNLDPEHYPGTDTPGEYYNDFWISGTGITGKENVDNVNYYEGLSGTTRQGTGATFNIANNGDGTYSVSSITNGGTNYRAGHKIKVLGTSLSGAENTTSYGAAEYGGGFGAWKVTDDTAGNTYLIFPQPANSTVVTGLLSVGDAIIIEWGGTEHTTTIAAALGAVPNDPYVGSFPTSQGYRLTDNFGITGQPDLNVGYVTTGNGVFLGLTPANDATITVISATNGVIDTVSISGTASGGVGLIDTGGTNIDVGSGLTLNIQVDAVTGSRIASNNQQGSNYVAGDVVYISGSEFANGSDGWEILSATTSGYNGEAFFSKSTYPTLDTTLLAVTVGAIAKFDNGATARVNVIRTADPSNWGVTFTTISGSLPGGVSGPISFFANDVEVTIVAVEGSGQVSSVVTAGSTPTNAIRVLVNGVDFTVVDGAWTMKQDLDGEAFVWTPTWNKAIGGASNDRFESVVYSKDGASIYAVGRGRYEVDYDQSLVVKYATSDGTIGWSKYLNSATNNSQAYGVATIGTSDIVVSGYEYVSPTSRWTQFVARMTSSGTVVWKKYLINTWPSDIDRRNDIQVDSDDNIYVTISYQADTPNFTYTGFHVTKLDQAGNVVWSRCVNAPTTNSYTGYGNGNRWSSLHNDQLVVAGNTYNTGDDYSSGLWASFPTDGFTYLGGEGDFVQMGAFRFSQGSIYVTETLIPGASSFTPSVQAPTITATDNLKNYATRDPIDLFEQHLHKMVDPKHGGLVFGDGSRQTFATDIMPQIKADRGYTITAQDSGKHIYYKNNSGTITIPLWARVKLPVGFTFTIVNRSGNDCYVQLESWPGPRGTILGSGRDASYYEWGIPSGNSGSMVTLLLLEAGHDGGNGNFSEPVWMISGPDSIYPND